MGDCVIRGRALGIHPDFPLFDRWLYDAQCHTTRHLKKIRNKEKKIAFRNLKDALRLEREVSPLREKRDRFYTIAKYCIPSIFASFLCGVAGLFALKLSPVTYGVALCSVSATTLMALTTLLAVSFLLGKKYGNMVVEKYRLHNKMRQMRKDFQDEMREMRREIIK